MLHLVSVAGKALAVFYVRWRNINTLHPDMLAAPRKASAGAEAPSSTPGSEQGSTGRDALLEKADQQIGNGRWPLQAGKVTCPRQFDVVGVREQMR